MKTITETSYGPWLIGLAIVALWACSIFAVPMMTTFFCHPPVSQANETPAPKTNEVKSRLASACDYSVLRQSANFGGMFGAINALFSGLALAAVAVTLWVESRSRREARKPLVATSVASHDGIVIDRPKLDPEGSSDVMLPLKIELNIGNYSDDAALNVAIVVSLNSHPIYILRQETPLVGERTFESEILLDAYGSPARELLGRLTEANAEPSKLTLVTKYRSLERINWETSVQYDLSLGENPEFSQKLLNTVRNRTWDIAEDGWRAPAQASLVASVEENSWDHRAT